MKIKLNTEDQLVTVAGSVFFSLFGFALGGLIFLGPNWATNDIPSDAATAMRWTGCVVLIFAVWTATSKTLAINRKDGLVVWRRRFTLLPMMPFLNHKIEAPLADVLDVILLRSKNGRKKLGNLNLRLKDGRELRLTHMSIDRGSAERLQEELLSWLDLPQIEKRPA